MRQPIRVDIDPRIPRGSKEIVREINMPPHELVCAYNSITGIVLIETRSTADLA